MKQRPDQKVAGVVARVPRPTPLGAAIVAAAVTVPLGLMWLVALAVF